MRPIIKTVLRLLSFKADLLQQESQIAKRQRHKNKRNEILVNNKSLIIL